jgi:RHS repeat-associated protein
LPINKSFRWRGRFVQTKLGGAGAVTIAGAFNVTGSSTLTGSGIGDDQQVWDIIGQLVSVHSTDGTSTYTYDADSQLVGADYSFQPNETFGYDPNGNPTSASVGDANRILSDGTFDYTYDAEGNRIRRVEIATGTSVEYQWDHRNRLVGTITRDGAGNVVQTEQIRYDDFGWKIERTLDADGAGPQAANTERFVHDRDQIVMVFADPATPSEIFTYGPRVDMVLSEQHGADLAWSLADHLGSVRDVVSSDGGTVLDHLTYNAFGLITGQTDAGAAPRFSFAGRELDTALNLYDERARYYDPSLQRFISEDPTGFMQSFLLPVGARELTFTLNVHFDPAGNGPQDAFEVALLDATTKASLLGGIGLTQTDAAANLEADGSVYQTAGVQISGLSNGRLPSVSGPLTATISLAGVAAGQAVSLYFDLLGFGASGSVVTIDDVRILTGAENTAPTANDDAFTLVEDTPKVIDVLTNDTDAEHDTLSAVIITAPAHGTLSTNADGTLTYIPAANYNGTDSFTYKANDGELDSAVATVSLSIAPVNDPPVAVNDVFATNEDTALVVSAPQGVLANDSDVDSATLTALLVGGPSHGTVLLNADGSFTYTPAANFNGTDSFTYKANDGELDSAVATVSLSIGPVNDPPVAGNDSFTTNEDTALVVSAPQGVLANDSDVDSATLTALLVGGPSHGTVVLNADGSFTYTPAANFNGTDSFTYKANDGELDSAVATVSLSIAPVNDPPVAFNISGSVPEHWPHVTLRSGEV